MIETEMNDYTYSNIVPVKFFTFFLRKNPIGCRNVIKVSGLEPVVFGLVPYSGQEYSE